MSDTDRLRSLPAIGATFVVLGLIGWAWFDLREFGQGALTGGVLIVLVAVAGMARRGRAS